MKAIIDRGKKFGKFRFLQMLTDRQLNIVRDNMIIILSILIGSCVYSFKHKCWIIKGT